MITQNKPEQKSTGNEMDCPPASATRSLGGSQLWHTLILIAVIGVFVFYALSYFSYLEDDPLITMRYAQNFWRGYGWVMNPGERVEGYSSPLHLWLMTLLLRFFSPDATIFIGKVLDICLGIGVIYQTRALAYLVFPRALWLADAAIVLLIVRPFFALSMINGLETGIATWFLTTGLVHLMRDQREKRVTVGTVLLFLGAAFSRPELTLTFPLLLLLRRRSGSDYKAALWYVVPFAAFLLCRWTYYHNLLPNTYYAKHAPFSETFRGGAGYFLKFAIFNPYELGIGLFVLGLVALLVYGKFRREILAVFLPHVLFVLACGGDWMVDGRFVTTILPICSVIVAGSVRWMYCLHSLKSRYAIMHPEAAMVACCVLMLLVWQDTLPTTHDVVLWRHLAPISEVMQPHPFMQRWMAGRLDGRYGMAKWIAEHVEPGQQVVSSEVGLPAFMNPRVRFIDFCGLTDPVVARMKTYKHVIWGVAPYDWMDPKGEAFRYFEKRRAEWIVMLDYGDGPHGRLENPSYVRSGDFTIYPYGWKWPIRTWRRRDVRPRFTDQRKARSRVSG